ncbi:hypothetical protein [Beijerinckia indica]|uniref:Uncharacterized protein n=1 Tax=Beijerinckia indica subsp. indica (strain ATCC 9039 / DSM 1715 / NCIMB 8712) TaxID=395963 RepID=B2IHU0_BEII9|nr:hypothetical protein [Beijerinckia indica]ACB95983.1 hypothetical protein Bind_2372 [Beijerinckia indica subsp. indica ATCC 9039]
MKLHWLPVIGALAFGALGFEDTPANALSINQNVIAQDSALSITEAQWHPRHRCRWVNVRVRGANGRWFWRRVRRCW